MQTKMLLALASITCCAALLPLAGALRAQAPATADPAAPRLAYHRIYADAAGESHFEPGTLPFRAIEGEGPVKTLGIHELAGSEDAAILVLRGGAEEDWHTAPRRQWVFVLRGTSEVQASDGEVRRFGPGSIMLMDDTHGKGHITRSVGSEDHYALLVPVDGAQ